MVQPVKNECTAALDHTLFLGCSVSSFSASAGLNEQTAEVTIQLVQDTCPAPSGKPKKYYDCDLAQQDWTDADPGFYGLTIDLIGAPAYFRIGDFEFSGLIQEWQELSSTSGNPAYQVKLVSPNAILKNTQLIINDYAGSVGNRYNLFNVFGYRETFGTACAQMYQSSAGVYSAGSGSVDGAVFGSPAEFFGGANVNDNGMQWNEILAATRILMSSFPATTNIWSPYGRAVFKSHTSSLANCMGLMPYDLSGQAYYYVDLSDVPTAPSYWRLNGTNTSLIDAISQICQDAGYDYYVELIPVVGGALGSGIHKFIKVRAINRSPIRSDGIITAYATSDTTPISYKTGSELRNEETQSFVVGGPKQSFYQAEQSTDPEGDGDPTPSTADDLIVPYFGLDSSGNAIVPELDGDGFWFFDAPSGDLALQLGNAKYGRAVSSTLEINEKELIAATESIDAWSSYASSNDTELWQALSLNMKGLNDLTHLIKFVANIANINNLRAPDFVAARKNAWPAQSSAVESEIMEIAYAWIKKFSDDFYGKKFMVRVPYTCGRVDSESGLITLSEQPSDGGWTEVTPVIGLSHPSTASDFFTLQDNRLGAFCRFDNADDIESANLSPNDYVSSGTSAWIKVSVSEEYVFLDKSTLFSPRAVIELPQPVREIEQDANDLNKSFKGLVDILTNFGAGAKANAKDKVNQAMANAGGQTAKVAMQTRSLIPDAVGFGIKSNILTYGPWGDGSIAGGVQVIQDEGLVPWEYGGFTTLNLAGNATASAGVTNNQTEEAGSVTVPGYPNIPLGAELRSATTGPFAGGSGPNLVENRTVTSVVQNSINTYTMPIAVWVGTYGPNVTNITCEVGEGGIQTTYQFKTWTPKFGRFARDNAQRIKQVGRQRLNFEKSLRAFSLQRGRAERVVRLDQIAGDRPGAIIGKSARGKQNTPHELLVGQLVDWNDGDWKRPVVVSESIIDLSTDLSNEYSGKAMMSYDGMFRPVSMDGDGNLPQYFQPSTGCQSSVSRGAIPPLDKQGEAGQLLQYNQDHSLPYLNPLANPSGNARSEIAQNLSDTPTVGHDIEILARDGGSGDVPASSIIMPIEGYAQSGGVEDSDYKDDYRFMALKGPLVIQGFGYDLDGFPVPNKVDDPDDARQGVFAETGLQMKFMDDHLRRSESWPVAPVDLRLDRERGVWTIPQLKFLLVQAQEEISSLSSGTATVQESRTLYDNDGNTISAPEVIIVDKVGYEEPLESGDLALVYFDPDSCEYCIIERDIPASGGSGNNLTGTYSDNCYSPNTVWNGSDIVNIDIGKGLNARGTASGSAYSLGLSAGIEYSSNENCYSDLVGSNDGFASVQFGAGINVSTLDSCTIGVAAGVHFYDAGRECFSPNVSGATGVGGGQTSLVNYIGLGRGMAGIQNESCTTTLTAGWYARKDDPTLSGYQECIETNLTTGESGLVSTLTVSSGLRAYYDGNCDLRLQAGVHAEYDPVMCVQGNLIPNSATEVPYHTIKFGKGMAAETGSGCVLSVGAGINAANTSTCVTGTDAVSSLYNKVNWGRGLNSQEVDACTLNVGLQLETDSLTAAKIYSGDCLTFTQHDSDDCGVVLDFAVKFPDDQIGCDIIDGVSPFCTFSVITGVNYIGCVVCCECCSGSGGGGGGTTAPLVQPKNEMDGLIPMVTVDSDFDPIPTHTTGPDSDFNINGRRAKMTDYADCGCYIYYSFQKVDLNFNRCGQFLGLNNEGEIVQALDAPPDCPVNTGSVSGTTGPGA